MLKTISDILGKLLPTKEHRSRLARDLGLSSSFVRAVVSGHRAVPVSETDRWSKALGMGESTRKTWAVAVGLAHSPKVIQDQLQASQGLLALYERWFLGHARVCPEGKDLPQSQELRDLRGEHGVWY